MRKDEYINEVISKIENKKARREVEKELSAHIDDRISYYTDAGYDEETANEKSISHMGAPEKVGREMSKLHKGVKWYNYFIVLPLILFSLWFYFMLWFDGREGGTIRQLLFYETFFTVVVLLVSQFGKRRSNKFITFLPLLSYSLFLAENLLCTISLIVRNADVSFGSSLIVSSAYVLTAKFKSIYEISNYYGIKVAPWITALSILLYVVIFTVLFINWRDTGKRFSIAVYKLNPVVDNALRIIMIISLILGVVSCGSIILYGNADNEQILYEEGVIEIYENDVRDITEPPNVNNNLSIIDCDWDWGTVFIDSLSIDYCNGDSAEYIALDDVIDGLYDDIKGDVVLEKYDEMISYYICRVQLRYKPSKEYVCVGFKDGYLGRVTPDYGEHKWIKTDKEQSLVFTVDYINEIELIIEPKNN